MSSEASSTDVTYGYINWASEDSKDTLDPEVQTPPVRGRWPISKQESTSSERSEGSPQVIVESSVLELKEPPPKPSRDPALLQSSEPQTDIKLEGMVPLIPSYRQYKRTLLVPHILEPPPRFRRQLAVSDQMDQTSQANPENTISEPSQPNLETRVVKLFDQPSESKTEIRPLQPIDELSELNPETRTLEPAGQPEARHLQSIDELSELKPETRALETGDQCPEIRALDPGDQPPETRALETVDQPPETRALETVGQPSAPEPETRALETVDQLLEPKAVEQIDQKPPKPNPEARTLELLEPEAVPAEPKDHQPPETSQDRMLGPLGLARENQSSREEPAVLAPPLELKPAVVPVAPLRQVSYSDQSTQTDPIHTPAVELYNSPELLLRNRLHLPPIPASPVPVRKNPPVGLHPTSNPPFMRSKSVPRQPAQTPSAPRRPSRPTLEWQYSLPEQRGSSRSPGTPGSGLNSAALVVGDDSSSGSSLDSLELSSLPSRVPAGQQREVGTLQREMNALFEEKMREIRCKSPVFFRGKRRGSREQGEGKLYYSPQWP